MSSYTSCFALFNQVLCGTFGSHTFFAIYAPPLHVASISLILFPFAQYQIVYRYRVPITDSILFSGPLPPLAVVGIPPPHLQ